MQDDLQGRGMVGVSMDEHGVIEMENQDTGATFYFSSADLDEVACCMTFEPC
jgi:hypothetical protein